MPRLSLQNVGKTFANGFRAVVDFHLDVAQGELVVLLGPSGSGKTTTLRMIAGLERVTQGTIEIGGRVVNHLPPRRRDVSMVFQHPALYPHLTVAANMAFPLVLRGESPLGVDKAVGRAAAMLGIEELLGRKPAQLSGGQRQRVALGRAVVRRPACFLLDEPLSSLDVELRISLRAELKRLQRRLDTATVHVTHDQEEAMALADRIVLLRDGRVEQAGTPDHLFLRPANRFVARFLGARPMNFLDGTIVLDGERLWFDTGGERLAVARSMAPPLGAMANRPVVLGVRPEDLHAGPVAGRSDNTLNVRVDAVERLGANVDVHLTTATEVRLVARLDGQSPPPSIGATLAISLDMDRAHFFADDDRGENLLT